MNDEPKVVDASKRFRPIIVTETLPGEKKPESAWDQARKAIDAYEKHFKDQPTPRIFIVVDAPQLGVIHCGEPCRPTDKAGILYAAAHMMIADMQADTVHAPRT